MSAAPSLAGLSVASRDEFVRALGGIFEHTPWIAERAWPARPFASVDELHRAMLGVLASASREAKLALICAHPELAGKEAAAGTMTVDSVGEQASAGLDRCTPDELARLRAHNQSYRETFGFPFVMAVKGKSRQEILATLASRIGNTREAEFARCIEEIGRIARLRLDAMFG
ncbi:MAG: 2-oxo-4-hydroxy-4-carboxy-5-ureidoimidazoline decarboxylase [Casimicrobiaceae bacterium]